MKPCTIFIHLPTTSVLVSQLQQTILFQFQSRCSLCLCRQSTEHKHRTLFTARYQQTLTVTVTWHLTTPFIMQSQTFYIHSLFSLIYLKTAFFSLAFWIRRTFSHTQSQSPRGTQTRTRRHTKKHCCNRKQRITNQSIVLFVCGVQSEKSFMQI